jgi:hypothetical protein
MPTPTPLQCDERVKENDRAAQHQRATLAWLMAASRLVSHWRRTGPTVEAQWCTHAAQLLSMGGELLAPPAEAKQGVDAMADAWRPIETVPKDGREVILREGTKVGAACWITWPEQRGFNGEVCEDAGEGWTVGYDGNLWKAPDGWQPMPTAGVAVPQTPKENDRG